MLITRKKIAVLTTSEVMPAPSASGGIIIDMDAAGERATAMGSERAETAIDAGGRAMPSVGATNAAVGVSVRHTSNITIAIKLPGRGLTKSIT